MAFARAPPMSVLDMFTSCLDPLNGRITHLLNFVGAQHLDHDGTTAGDHAPAAGRLEEQGDRRRHPRPCQRSWLPATRSHQRGGAEPSTRRLQPGWAVSTKAPGYLALGRAASLRG